MNVHVLGVCWTYVETLVFPGPHQQKTQEHAIPSHRRTNTSPPKPTPPQREGTNRFLPCGVSELLRQTEQELTMGRSLHARNAQMGPRMLQHLLSTPTQSRRRPAPGLKKITTWAILSQNDRSRGQAELAERCSSSPNMFMCSQTLKNVQLGAESYLCPHI